MALDKAIIEKAIYDYHNTDKTIPKILDEYGMSKATFYRHLDYKEEWRDKNRHREYNFNIDAFKEESRSKYYWLGFIAADGAIWKNTLTIELKDIDAKHLAKFNIFCNNEYPITSRVNNNNSSCVKTQINSYKLIEYLATYNIVQKKSLIFEIPEDKIPEQFMLDFIRGLIDGDGFVSINNHQQITLGFCSGNKKCVEQVKSILGIDNKINVYEHTYSFQVAGNKKAKSILDRIYENSEEINRLDRKYSIYKTLN